MGRFCHNCGLAVNEGDKFCHKCGTKLYESSVEQTKEEHSEERTSAHMPVQAPPPIIQLQTQSQEPVYYMQVPCVEEEPYVPDQGWRQIFFRWDNRLNRKRYFLRLMLVQLIFVPVSILMMFLPHDIVSFLGLALGVVWLIPIGMLCVRRCHDLGRSGWFLIKTAIPILGMLWCIKYLLRSGDDDSPILSSTIFVIVLGLPFVGILVWIYLMCADGMRGGNEYGPDPLGTQVEVKSQGNKVLDFIAKMEAPGEMRGVLAIFAIMALVTVVPGMVGSLFTDSKSNAVARTQQSQQAEQTNKAVQNKQGKEQIALPEKPALPEMPKPVLPEPKYPPGAQEKYEQARAKEASMTDGKSPQQKLTPVQLEAANTLSQFHDNITKKDLRKAYDCMSPNMQKRVSYEGWAPGFKTTVSSEIYDVKVAFENNDRMALTYFLKTVDNPGGEKNYTGTAVMAKTAMGWKIEEITNKLK